MYHRISTALPDPFSLNVTPAHFAEHLAVLRRWREPMHLREMLRQSSHDRRHLKPVAITFDDGYLDNYSDAMPLLTAFGVPGTFFVPTGILSGEREFMWDELEQILLGANSLPRWLRMTIGADVFDFDLGIDAVYRLEDADRHRYWTVDSGALPTARHALFRRLHWRLRTEPFVIVTVQVL